MIRMFCLVRNYMSTLKNPYRIFAFYLRNIELEIQCYFIIN